MSSAPCEGPHQDRGVDDHVRLLGAQDAFDVALAGGVQRSEPHRHVVTGLDHGGDVRPDALPASGEHELIDAGALRESERDAGAGVAGTDDQNLAAHGSRSPSMVRRRRHRREV